MKILSKILLLSTGLASATTSLVLAADSTATPSAIMGSATATDAKPHRHARHKALQRRQLAARALGRRLDLSGEQKTQLKTLRRKTAAEVRGIRQDATLSPDQQKAKIRAARQDARAHAGRVLTPAQKRKTAKLRHHLRRLAAK